MYFILQRGVSVICREITRVKAGESVKQTKNCIYQSQRRGIYFDRLTIVNSITTTSKNANANKPWRESSSLIIVAPMNNCPPFSLGYLMIERSKGSRVSPGGTVFPGGVLSPIDSSPKWIQVFKDANLDLGNFQFLGENAHIPEIYQNEVMDSPLPKNVIMRLAAIRETFEEVGILICRRSCGSSNPAGHMYEYDELRERKVVEMWQKKILKNPEEFINMCIQLKCVPDLHAIGEWSNWLTPTMIKSKARFDTIFYMLILPKMLRVVFEKHEVAGAQWASAECLLKEYEQGNVKLMPPQMYELSRLFGLQTISELQDRLRCRQENGIERFFPVVQELQDGQAFILPGDELYPENPDFVHMTKTPTSNDTFDKLLSIGGTFHRAKFSKKGINAPIINVTRYGHIY